MTAPSPERRAELLQWAEDGMADAPRSYEVRYFLAKTEPVDDGEVGRVVDALNCRCEREVPKEVAAVMAKAASLTGRLARELAEAQAALAVHRPPPTASVQGSAGNLKYEDGWT